MMGAGLSIDKSKVYFCVEEKDLPSYKIEDNGFSNKIHFTCDNAGRSPVPFPMHSRQIRIG